jgi:hypothetical protein
MFERYFATESKLKKDGMEFKNRYVFCFKLKWSITFTGNNPININKKIGLKNAKTMELTHIHASTGMIKNQLDFLSISC